MKQRICILISALSLIAINAYTQDFREVCKAVASDRAEGDYFGNPVSISGNYAIIGAAFEDEDTAGLNTLDDAGSAYIFKRDVYGNWHEVQKLVSSDRDAGDRFGNSVSICDNYAIVGTWFEDEDTSDANTMEEAGSVYIFKRDGYGNWQEIQKLVASDRATGDHFGRSVSISDSLLIVGATWEDEDTLGGNTIADAGSAYIFARDENGNWHERQKIVASDRGVDDHFGLSVDISADYIVVSGRDEDEDVQGENTMDGAGSAYIFERNGNGDWMEVQKIVAPIRAAGDQFANSVNISGNYIAIGTPTEDEDAVEGNTLANSGSVYIYKREINGNWSNIQKVVASDREGEEYFGNEVCISGNRMIIGAHYEDNNASGGDSLEYAGAAYLFTRNNNDEWIEAQKIVASDRDVFDFFGYSVSISGDYAIAGARTESEDALGENTLENAGSAYIFESCTPGSATDPDNIIENGNFEDCMLFPWSVYNADYLGVTAEAVLTDGKCTVTNITLADEPAIYQVQLMQILSALQAGRLETGSTYELTFNAWAEADNRPCHVSFEQSVDPWANIFNDDIVLNTASSSYSFEFVINEVYSDMQLTFQLGTDASPATFDNVRLVKKPVVSFDNRSLESRVRIMPNPVSDLLIVIAPSGSKIGVYNNLGVLVQYEKITADRLQLDVSNLPKGLYFLEISLENNLCNRKVSIN